MTKQKKHTQIVPAAVKESIDSQARRTKAILDNVTDKKYTLFFLNKPLINWDSLPFLRDALKELPAKNTTFIHYNEGGVNDYLNG